MLTSDNHAPGIPDQTDKVRAALVEMPPGLDIGQLVTPTRRVLAVGSTIDVSSLWQARSMTGQPPDFSLPPLSCDPGGMAATATPIVQPGKTVSDQDAITFGPTDDNIIHAVLEDLPETWPGSERVVRGGAGNDVMILLDNQARVEPGDGADTIVFCGEDDALNVALYAPSDGQRDLVVVARSFFDPPSRIPATRTIMIEGLGDLEDRLILDLPVGATVREDEIFGLVIETGTSKTTISLSPAIFFDLDQTTLDQVYIWRRP